MWKRNYLLGLFSVILMKKEDAVAENRLMFSSKQNYFELLAIDQQFEIDRKLLDENYIKLQQLIHPDKLVNKSNAEKILAMEYSAKLNEIYSILKDDKKRAEYLLLLQNIIVNTDEDNVKPDLELLADIMDLSENPDLEVIEKEKQKCWKIFKETYLNNLRIAAQAIIKLQYLNKI